jgi:aldose 1-epimerase
MKTEKEFFGTAKNGQPVDLFRLTNSAGIRAEFISFGAAVKSFCLPDKSAQSAAGLLEITYGFDTLAEYEANRFFFGAAIGRYANRIAQGSFFLGGKKYALARNNDENHLHGGIEGFDRKVWKAEEFWQDRRDSSSVAFSYNSPDGEEGYPGNIEARVIYTLTESDEFIITYEGTADAETPFNPTNHTFWNLAGAQSGTILEHLLELNCPFYIPVRGDLIPSGEILAVKNTPLDFSTAKPFGADIESVPPNGYDHCFVINRTPVVHADGAGKPPAHNAPSFAARVTEPRSGRTMEVFTTMPGIQVYTGNNITPSPIAGGIESRRRGAFCLETEFFPDSVNISHFPSPFLKPGEKFFSRTVYKFSRAGTGARPGLA